MFKNKDERKRRRELKKLEQIAEAFIKARGVYPLEYEAFLAVAGQDQVDQFYYTMQLIDLNARKIGYAYQWTYDDRRRQWYYVFTDLRHDNIEEAEEPLTDPWDLSNHSDLFG